MGQNSIYIAVDDTSLEALWQLDNQEFRNRFLEIKEDSKYKRLDIGKIWDALHCTLTGLSAKTPIENDKLSEAIVGVYPKVYGDEDYSLFVSIIDNSEIADILIALKPYNADKLSELIDIKTLQKEKVYPSGIWKEDSANLVTEMDSALTSLRLFFNESIEEGNHILATIL